MDTEKETNYTYLIWSVLFLDKLEEDGIKPIQGILGKLGLPPLPPREASANFSWETSAGRGRRMLGLNVLLSVQVAEDVRNTSRNRVVVSAHIYI